MITLNNQPIVLINNFNLILNFGLQIRIIMLKNYIVTSWRSLLRNWEFSLVNVAGLSLGMAVCLILFAWVNFELSYDRQYAQADLIYRVNLVASISGQNVNVAATADGVQDYLTKFAGVQSATRVLKYLRGAPVLIKNAAGEILEEKSLYLADSTFFQLFNFHFIAGNANTVLRDNQSIVLTRSTVKKYFGDEDPINKDIEIQNKVYRVDGVVEDLPMNSSFRFNMITAIYPAIRNESLARGANSACYVLFRNTDVIPDILNRLNEDTEVEAKKLYTGVNDYWRYEFVPIKNIHLYSKSEFEMEPVSNIQTVQIFSLVALLVLLMAIINYVNLTSAKAINRAKEIGVRKVVGALRQQLVGQFITESLMVSLVSFGIALLLALAMIPLFNLVSEQHLVGSQLFSPWLLAMAITSAVAIGIISGIYPAFVITSYKITTIVKGRLSTSDSGSLTKKTFVVIQFAIGVALIFCSTVVFQQFNFIQSKPLGYNRNAVLAIPLDKTTRDNIESLKNELSRLTNVVISATGNTPTSITSGNGLAVNGGEENLVLVRGTFVDENYVPTLGFELMAGRNFEKGDMVKMDSNRNYVNANDRMSIIINEATLNKLGLTEDEAFNKILIFEGSNCQVVGILKDFHFASLRQQIEPIVLNLQPQKSSSLLVRLTPGDLVGGVENVQKVYASLINHRPFHFTFLDDEFDNLYKGEKQLSATILMFTLLSIFIIGLGLSSLIAYTVTQRLKEISIRKVLGVSFPQVLRLLANQFMTVITTGIVISLTVAYYLMQNWLDNFAYRISVGFLPFTFSCFFGLTIYLAVMGFYSRKAFNSNVAEMLRGTNEVLFLIH
jgi:putative ABC transport system permease protein